MSTFIIVFLIAYCLVLYLSLRSTAENEQLLIEENKKIREELLRKIEDLQKVVNDSHVQSFLEIREILKRSESSIQNIRKIFEGNPILANSSVQELLQYFGEENVKKLQELGIVKDHQ